MSANNQKTIIEYTNLLSLFLESLKQANTYPSVPRIVQFILDRWEAKKSPSGGGKFISAMNYWYADMADFSISDPNPVHMYIKSHRRVWGKTKRVDRIPFTIKDISTIIKTCPPGAILRHWRAYVVIAWVFLLRHGEIHKLSPKNFRTYQDKDDTCMWEAKIIQAKTAQGIHDKQWVRFSEEDIPLQYIYLLSWYAEQGEDFVWQVGPLQGHITHLRSCLKVPAENDDEYVFHCTRHGRATWLTEMAGYNLEKLQTAGRWKSRASVYVYMH